MEKNLQILSVYVLILTISWLLPSRTRHTGVQARHAVLQVSGESRYVLFRNVSFCPLCSHQQRLDLLNQGTGIGLAVCKNLSKLLDADLYLDETFESGVPGCPGTRFTLQFHQEPLQLETPAATTGDSKHVEAEKDQETNNELPDHVRVLFVDDVSLAVAVLFIAYCLLAN